jgi:NADH:ubiquinone oxidoreductase subunit 3 (subunit A)
MCDDYKVAGLVFSVRRCLSRVILPAGCGNQTSKSARRRSMEHYLLTAMWCLIVVTGVIVYMPMMYARKTDKILKVLQQIEANTTRKP